MFTKKLIFSRHFLWLLPLLALVFQFAGASPAAALSGAYVFDTQATVSVSDLTLHPPNPCYQDVRLSGDFVIQAHIVFPPEPIFPPDPIIPTETIVILHLDATGISGIGLSDGALYQGTQGISQTFFYTASPMVFDAAFSLVPSQPNHFPPSPCSSPQFTFEAQIFYAGEGSYGLSVTILPNQ